MRRAVETGQIDENMNPSEYPDWLKEAIDYGQQVREAEQRASDGSADPSKYPAWLTEAINDAAG